MEESASAAGELVIRANILGDDEGNGNGRRLSKVGQAVVLGAHCTVELVRPRVVTHEHLIPAA